MTEVTLRFGEFRLDLARRTLYRGEGPVRLGGRALDILCMLAEANGRVVRKDELMARVWPGVAVEEGNLHVHVSALRKMLDDAKSDNSIIITVPNRGYRLARIADASGHLPDLLLRSADRPSIALLPFENLTGDSTQDYFVDGMVEEIITALSRLRWLFVIPRTSSLAYKGRAIDGTRAGRELGARYVLEGTVRKAAGRVRIGARLFETETGKHLWADRFEGSSEDVFNLQDQVATSMAGAVEPALQAAEVSRSTTQPTPSLTAYDLHLRALALANPATKERVFEALSLLQQALAIDCNYGPALSWAAMCHRLLIVNGWVAGSKTHRGKAIGLARKALQIGKDDPDVLATAALVLAQFGEDFEAMAGLIDRALALNPSFARGWYASALLRNLAGEHDLAIAHVQTALRLSPRERIGQSLRIIGIAYFFKGQFSEAAANLLLSIQDHPGSPPALRFLAACYAHMGQLDEAREIIAQLRTMTSAVAPSVLSWRKPEDRELLLSGLRLAMAESE